MAWIAAIIFMLLLVSPGGAVYSGNQASTVLFREDFATLDNWNPFYFPKIKSHSVYAIEHKGGQHYLKTESHASASALVYKDSFNVRDYPRVRWRWKVDNIYKNADPFSKSGDDYPIRVYIMFAYDPDKAGTFESMKYGAAKKIYGEYPPHSSINYVWASRTITETVVTSPYTDRAKMIILEQGEQHVGAWRDEDVNIIDDYRKAFGTEPPSRARIAIMNDSDNTGEHAVSYVEYIEVSK